MADFRVLHISDFHFSKKDRRVHIIDIEKQNVLGSLYYVKPSYFKPTTYEPNIARLLARFIYREKASIDLIIISGDLATTGLDDDLSEAWNYVSADPVRTYWSRSGATLSPVSQRIVLVPGNHDRYDDITGKPNGQRFDELFKSPMWNSATRTARKVIEKGGQHFGIVCIDFSLFPDLKVSLKERFGMGDADPALLSELEDQTQCLRSEYDGICVSWVMHFPPCFPDLDDINLRLNNEDGVIALAKKLRVETILAGHVHKGEHYIKDGVRIISAGTATSLAGDDYSFNIVDFAISNSSMFVNKVFKYKYIDGDGYDDFFCDSILEAHEI